MPDTHTTREIQASERSKSRETQVSFCPEDYQILGELGRGGTGVVYKAYQRSLGRVVALKFLLGATTVGTARSRFMIEAEAMARLQHPNMVQIFTYGECEETPYLVMEYVPGGSVADALKNRSWTAEEAARLVRTLAEAVHHAHQQGIVHRDLKPANVLLDPQGTPKIADFGLAKLLDQETGLTHSGAILGTPNYMAPEQARGLRRDIGPWSDIYALGAFLYELLAGQPPFEGSTPLRTLHLVRTQEHTPIQEVAPSIPDALGVICEQCLAKDPNQRYASARALAEDLDRFLENKAPLATVGGPSRPSTSSSADAPTVCLGPQGKPARGNCQPQGKKELTIAGLRRTPLSANGWILLVGATLMIVSQMFLMAFQDVGGASRSSSFVLAWLEHCLPSLFLLGLPQVVVALQVLRKKRFGLCLGVGLSALGIVLVASSLAGYPWVLNWSPFLSGNPVDLFPIHVAQLFFLTVQFLVTLFALLYARV